MTPRLKRYHTGDSTSYTLGAYPSLELLRHRPDWAQGLHLSTSVAESEGAQAAIAAANAIDCPVYADDDRNLERIRPKGNVFVAATFTVPPKADVSPTGAPLLALDTPSNRGNLGTIFRTALAFAITDVALVGSACDPWDPETVRAAMGACFRLSITHATDLDHIASQAPQPIVALATQGSDLTSETLRSAGTLLFGNESRGLPEAFLPRVTTQRIPHTDAVDSLNLAISVGITLQQHYQAR